VLGQILLVTAELYLKAQATGKRRRGQARFILCIPFGLCYLLPEADKKEAMGITYRKATIGDAAAVARVQVGSWRESFRGVLDQAWLDSMSVEQRTEAYRQRIAGHEEFYELFVAVDATEVVGICDVGDPHAESFGCAAELYSLYLDLPYQRRGIGRGLFRRAGELLLANGRESVYLEVLAVNPYRGFYEKLGGEVCGQGQIERLGREYRTLFYRWPRLAQTLQALAESTC
jgi:GNAT superfamily N-acetyltransferase